MDCELAIPSIAKIKPGSRAPTTRELECLHGVAAGRTASEIAVALEISQRTVDHHIANVMLKLRAPTRAAAVARALAWRLIAIEEFLH